MKIGYVLAALLVVGALYKIISPKDPFQTAARVVAPWADIERPSRVDVSDIAPGDVTIFQGEFVDVSAAIRGGGKNDEFFVLYSTLDGQVVDRQETMVLDETGTRHSAKIPASEYGAQTSLQYKIVAGDAETRWYIVEVVPAPHVLVTKVEYHPPAYTKREAYEDNRGDIDSLEGTLVTIHARANREIASAKLVFDPLPDGVTPETVAASSTQSLEIRDIEEQNITTSFYLRLDGERKAPWHRNYAIRFDTVDGYNNADPVVHSIEVKPDLAPLVEILSPVETEIEVPLNRKVDIEVRTVDPDFAISKLRLVAIDKTRDLLDVALLETPVGKGGQIVQKFEFLPERYDLKVDDVVDYWAIAEDNRRAVRGGTPEPNVTRSTPNYRIRIIAPESEAGDLAADEESEDTEKMGDGSEDNPESSAGDNSQQGSNNAGSNNSDDTQGESGDENSGDMNSGGANDAASNSDPTGSTPEDGSESGQENLGQENSASQSGGQDQASNQSGDSTQQSDGSAASQSGDSQSGDGSQSGGQNNGQGNSQQSDGQQSDGPSQPLENDGSQDGDVFDAINQHRQQQEDLRDKDLNSKQQNGNQAGQENSSEENSASAGQENSDAGGQQNAGANQQNAESQSGGQQSGSSDGNKNGQNQSGGGSEQQPSGSGGSQDQQTGNGASQEQSGGAQSGGQKPDQKQSGGSESGENSGGAAGPEEKEPSGSGGSEGGQPQGGMKPEENKAQGGGGEENNQGSGGMGQNDTSGGGQKTDGGGSPQSQAENEKQNGKEKSGGGGQGGQQQEDGGKSPSGSNEGSDSQGENGGDRKGGGQQGGGQSAKQPGQDSAGSSSAGEQGDGAANEPGAGESGDRAGGDQVTDSPTGRSGEQTGEGSNTGSAQGGRENQNDPRQGERQPSDASQSGNQSGGGSPSSQQNEATGERVSDVPGDGRGTMPTGGGEPADNHPSDTPLPDIEPGSDEANLEYARKATDLSLEYLKNQKDKPDPELLDKLGWTKDDLAKFVERWERMKGSAKNSDANPDAARRLDDSLRSLGLRPPQDKLRSGEAGGTRLSGQRDAASRSRPPKEYAEQYRAFSKFATPEGE